MAIRLNLHKSDIDTLLAKPDEPLQKTLGGTKYTARIAIPRYVEAVSRHYANIAKPSLRAICSRADIPFEFQHFGLIVHFEKRLEIFMYDEDMKLDDGVREVIRSCGPVILKNVCLGPDNREQGHRAIFKNLNFHYDRAVHQPEQHSLYYRDPFDAEQAEPRTSSTLFIANIVACLQEMKEQGRKEPDSDGVHSRYFIFEEQVMDEVIGKIIVDHRWDEPRGTGEISVLDNRTALHASHYRNGRKGYKIGVRYLK